MDDELSLDVYLRVQGGRPWSEIAESLGLSVDEVQLLFEHGNALVHERLRDPELMAARQAEIDRARRRWTTPAERAASARDLLSAGGCVVVEPPEPGEPVDATWLVLFGDVASTEFDDLVRLTVERLPRVDGVADVEADDRDLIAVTGTITREELQTIVSGWWDHWLRGVVDDDAG